MIRCRLGDTPLTNEGEASSPEAISTNQALLFGASALTASWGVAHLFATRSVVVGFGDHSDDNRRIITMEWIVEGIALISTATFVIVAAAIAHGTPMAQAVFGAAIGTLVALAIVSLFTGFRVAFLPYKLCPIIFTASAVLIGLGAWR